MPIPIAIRQIKAQLFRKYADIPPTDYIGRNDNAEDKDVAMDSRRLAALAIEMETGETDPETLIGSVTDGAGDKGLDAIYIDESHKKIILVQSKWRSDGSGSINLSETSKFANSLREIISGDLAHSPFFKDANSRVKAKLSDIDSALNTIGYTVHAIMITTAKKHIKKENLSPIKPLLDEATTSDTSLFYFREITQGDIYNYFTKEISRKEITLTIELHNWGCITEPYKAYYGTTSASSIAEWYQEYGNDLFSQNIRSFKGSSDVNQGIINTLKEEPGNFFLYNNGIKLLCSKTTRTAKNSNNHTYTSIELKDVSIVNGAQTTGAIGKFYQDPNNSENEALVFVEVIDLTGMTESAAATITKLSNTQNRIEGKDFASLDPTQCRIAQQLALEKEPVTYIYKTGEASPQETDALYCTLDEAIPALACEQDDIKLVTLAKGNVGALTADTTKAPYKKLFNSGTSGITLYNSVQVMRYIEAKLEEEYKNKEETRLIAIHGNRFILHLVLQSIKEELQKKNSTLSEQILSTEKLHSLVDKFLPKYVQKTRDTFYKLYPKGIASYAFRNQSKCTEMQNAILGTIDQPA